VCPGGSVRHFGDQRDIEAAVDPGDGIVDEMLVEEHIHRPS
jgi:hypothetical protein